MKKRAFIVTLLLLMSVVLISALAAGGDSSDPLISLSYLNGAYTDRVDAAVDTRLDNSDQEIRKSISTSTSAGSCAVTWAETRLKEKDTLKGSTGLNVTVLAGSVKVAFSSGTVVDVSSGATVASGTTLSERHRYMVAEDTSASFTVTSKTAVVDYMGYYAFTYSNAVDYNAMATALKTMHLFKGSFTGYGSGYDLEAAPTRLQALIMFIRVLGEEDAALAYTGKMPFGDIAKGSDASKYVGYAYSKGYTNGYTATTFQPSKSVNAYQYTEFLLRALGYRSAENRDLSQTLSLAQSSGVLTSGEVSMLKSSKFLRAQLVYLSYYALNATLSGKSDTLQSTLIAKGVFTSAEAATAKALVTGSRLA